MGDRHARSVFARDPDLDDFGREVVTLLLDGGDFGVTAAPVRKSILESLLVAELDICIGPLQRAIRREDGDPVPAHRGDDSANALLAALRGGEAGL